LAYECRLFQLPEKKEIYPHDYHASFLRTAVNNSENNQYLSTPTGASNPGQPRPGLGIQQRHDLEHVVVMIKQKP